MERSPRIQAVNSSLAWIQAIERTDSTIARSL